MNYFQKIIIKAAPIMSAVYSLFLSTIILSLLGYYLDKKLETFPIIFLFGLISGLSLGFYQLIKISEITKKWYYNSYIVIFFIGIASLFSEL